MSVPLSPSDCGVKIIGSPYSSELKVVRERTNGLLLLIKDS